MRRYPVLERVEQVTELGLDPLAAHPENPEDSFLKGAIVNADASAGDLDAVENAVVRARSDTIRLRIDQVHVLRPGRRERMMAVGQVALVVLLEEVHRVDPREFPLPLRDQVAPSRDL